MKIFLVGLSILGIAMIAVFSVQAAMIVDGVSWTRFPENPLSMGVEGTILRSVADPWVIYDGSTFKMWFHGADFSSFVGTYRIYYATSGDGVHWTTYGMVLDVGVPGSWDEGFAYYPVVLFDGGEYKMWYSGARSGGSRPSSVGYATSLDGIHWVKYAGNPVLVPGGNGGWDDWNIGGTSIIFNGTHYVMLYAAQQFLDSDATIGVATSVDGISWVKHSNNPVLVPGSDWDNHWLWEPGPMMINGSTYVVWYSGVDYSEQMSIGIATSPDGVSWSKYDGNPVFEPGPIGSWDSKHTWAGSIVQKDSNLLLFYTGCSIELDSRYYKIGLATSYWLPSWEYVFEDPCRGTVLKISTDDKYFQFIAPETTFPVKHDPNMKVVNYPSFTYMAIYYEDSRIKLTAFALDDRFDSCIACAKNMETGKTHLLVDKLGIE